jgi:hypothetical protein
MSINFDVDLGQEANELLKALVDRNDLHVIIKNGTSMQLNVDREADHGNIRSVGSLVLPAVQDKAGETVNATTCVIGVDAAGMGSVIKVWVGSGGASWGFQFYAVPLRDNQFCVLSWGWPKAARDVFNSLPGDAAFNQANGPVFTLNAWNANLTVQMTNESPAKALITFAPA